MILEKVYDELMAQIEDLKKAVAGGSGGGSKDYDKLDNRPKVNNITLSGNKKSSDLKIAYSMTEAEYAAATKNAESIYCLQENAGTLTDSAYVNLEVADWTKVSGVYKQTQPFVFEVIPAAGWTIDDVSIETGIATVDSYEVTADPLGLSITYAAETLPEYGITATVTVTINQPAGATRIVKGGITYSSKTSEVIEIPKGTGTTSRDFTFNDTPKKISIFWDEGGTSSSWSSYYSFIWGSRRAYGFAGKQDAAIQSQDVKVASISYSDSVIGFTITAPNAGSAVNSNGTNDHGLMYVEY